MSKQYAIRLATDTVVIDFSINGRELPTSPDSSYNLPSLITQIIDAGGILTPIGVEKMADGRYRVIDGFRRAAAVKQLRNMPKPEDISQEKWDALQANLNEMEFIAHEELTPDERNRILFNHGSQSPLTRAETVKQVWRLAGAGNGEQQIYTQLFTVLLALASKREQEKLKTELKALTTERERAARVSKFFKGKIKDYFLDAYYLGEYVQKCVIETEAGRMKPKGEKTTVDGVDLFKTSQPRIVELSAMKRRDTSKDGLDGKGNKIADWDATKDGLSWNAKDGGIRFNAKIAEFLKVDSGITGPTIKAMDTGDMQKRKEQARSSAVQLAWTLAKGEALPEGADLLAMDANAAALEGIQKVTLSNLETLRKMDTKLYAVFAAIAVPDNSSDKFAAALAAFMQPVSEPETQPAPNKGKGQHSKQHAR